MNSLVAVSAGLALLAFCTMHTVHAVIEEREKARKDAEVKRIRKELNDEISNGGNVARIASLRKRLLDLEAD